MCKIDYNRRSSRLKAYVAPYILYSILLFIALVRSNDYHDRYYSEYLRVIHHLSSITIFIGCLLVFYQLYQEDNNLTQLSVNSCAKTWSVILLFISILFHELSYDSSRNSVSYDLFHVTGGLLAILIDVQFNYLSNHRTRVNIISIFIITTIFYLILAYGYYIIYYLVPIILLFIGLCMILINYGINNNIVHNGNRCLYQTASCFIGLGAVFFAIIFLIALVFTISYYYYYDGDSSYVIVSSFLLLAMWCFYLAFDIWSWVSNPSMQSQNGVPLQIQVNNNNNNNAPIQGSGGYVTVQMPLYIPINGNGVAMMMPAPMQQQVVQPVVVNEGTVTQDNISVNMPPIDNRGQQAPVQQQ